MVCLVSTATRAQTDSIRTETLPEIVVNSDGQIETAEKAVRLTDGQIVEDCRQEEDWL